MIHTSTTSHKLLPASTPPLSAGQGPPIQSSAMDFSRSRYKFGRPKRLTHVIRQQHDCMMELVGGSSAVSEVFIGTNRMRQDFVLASTYLGLLASVMLIEAYHGERAKLNVNN
ncbi:hypothetical protein AAHC03_013876 [Spirometra sp. Aus1]